MNIEYDERDPHGRAAWREASGPTGTRARSFGLRITRILSPGVVEQVFHQWPLDDDTALRHMALLMPRIDKLGRRYNVVLESFDNTYHVIAEEEL